MKHSKFEQTFFVHKFAILISLQENFVRKQAFLRQLAEILHHIKNKAVNPEVLQSVSLFGSSELRLAQYVVQRQAENKSSDFHT